jgi:ADP-ribose pyrophosphatase
MRTWKTLSRQTVLDRGKWLRVEDHTVELTNGRIIEQWPWLITPDYINVVAVTDDDKLLCLRQMKYALDGSSLAPIGGYIEPNEEPLAAAKRELLEETGYEAGEWIELGHYRIDPNRGVGTGYFYLAHHARRVADPTADDLEEQELLLLSRSEVAAALDAGEFKVLAWALNVALALRHIPA